MARLEFDDLDSQVGSQLFELGGRARQRGKRAVMDGDDRLGPQQAAGQGGLAWSHGEVVADGQQREVRPVKLVNELHVAKDGGVSRVIDLQPILEFNDIAAGLPGIDDLAFILDAARVQGMHHGDPNIAHDLGTALVHGFQVLNTLLAQPRAEFVNPHHLRLVFFGDFNHVAHVVEVAVGDQDHVNRLETVLNKLGKYYSFHRYDGAGHAFFNASRVAYRAEQAADGWSKVFDFFHKHLG